MTNWVVARLNDLIELGHDWLLWPQEDCRLQHRSWHPKRVDELSVVMR